MSDDPGIARLDELLPAELSALRRRVIDEDVAGSIGKSKCLVKFLEKSTHRTSQYLRLRMLDVLDNGTWTPRPP